MNRLPQEVIENIIFNTKPEDIAELCKTNVLFSQLCSDPRVQKFFDILNAKRIRELEDARAVIRDRLSPESRASWAKTARPYIREFSQRYPKVDRSSLYRDLSPTLEPSNLGNATDLKRFRQGVNRRFVKDNPQILEELANDPRSRHLFPQSSVVRRSPLPRFQGPSLAELARFE